MKKAFSVILAGLTNLDEIETRNYITIATSIDDAKYHALEYAKHNLKYWLMRLKSFKVESISYVPGTDFYEEEDFAKHFKELQIA